MATKTSKLSLALAHLAKKSKIVDMDNRVATGIAANQMPCISTGCILIDHLIGGVMTESGDLLCPGFAKGRIIEIYGGEGSGKTSLCLQAAVRNQQEGGCTLYLDYENAMSLQYAAKLGLNIEDEDTFTLWNPAHFEEGAELIAAAVAQGVELIIVDSVAAMVPQKLMEGNASDTGQIGILARNLSSFIPRIVKDVRKHGSTIVFINQVRSRIKTSMYDAGPDEDTSGGKALKYYASVRLKLHPRTKLKAAYENKLTGEREEQNHATIVRATCVKNKIAPHQGHTVDVVVRFGSGFDNVQSILDIALKRDLIHKKTGWFNWVDHKGVAQKYQGLEKVYNHLKNDRAEFIALTQKIENFFTTIDTLDTVNLRDEDITEEHLTIEEVPEVASDLDDNADDYSPSESLDD